MHLRILFACTAASAFLEGASAFTLPPRHALCNKFCNRVDQTRNCVGVGRRPLRAETAGDNEEDASRAINKGAAPKEASAKSTASKTAGKSKGAQKSQRKKKQPKKTLLEISAQSLTPSQTNLDPAQKQAEDADEDDQNYAYNIPKTGYSLADQLENKSPENRELFETTLTPIMVGIREKKEVEFQYDDDGFPVGFQEAKEDEEEERAQHQGVARIDTISTQGNVGEEPVRWLVSLGEVGDEQSEDSKESYALVDLPPYSDRLADEIRSFMDPEYNVTAPGSTGKASLDVILITNQQCIHYDTSPGVYVTRRSDMAKWKKAFPEAEVVMYRLDIPRECREEVTQVLDGYGPWGWNEDEADSEDAVWKFVETGRPLQLEEWDDDTKTQVLNKGELPPDELEGTSAEDGDDNDDNDDPQYSLESIRQREEKHRLLAVYTPGHTFGSVTYIFPQRGICCSGHTLPLESSAPAEYDNEEEDSPSPVAPQGPRLDYQGYLATSASRPRQMSSASSLINNYIDRFRVVLPARGDMVLLDSEKEMRKRELMESIGLYRKIGDIYSRLGIVE